jgi:hypothetical protein
MGLTESRELQREVVYGESAMRTSRRVVPVGGVRGTPCCSRLGSVGVIVTAVPVGKGILGHWR